MSGKRKILGGYAAPKIHMKDPNSKSGIVCHFVRSIYLDFSTSTDWDKITCLSCKKMKPKKTAKAATLARLRERWSGPNKRAAQSLYTHKA